MKSIALIADIQGWAFDLAANIIKNCLEENCKVDIFYSKSENFNEDLLTILKTVKDYDVIHFFWRKTLLPLNEKEFINTLEQNNINFNILKNKLSTGVYDHLFIEDIEYKNIFNNVCKKYVVSSNKLYDIYSDENNNYKNPYAVLGDTFEESSFYPKNIERFENRENKTLTIGWVGNSLWNSKLKDENGKDIDFKGFHTILTPVIEELKQEGFSINTYYADKNTNYIPNEGMCDYYSKLDVYVCTSITEGTPKPLLEAMGCGVPVITTDVGIAKEYLGTKQQNFIIGERKIGQDDEKIKNELKNKIKELYNNRYLLKELSQENYANSKKFNATAMKEKYKDYFMNF